MPSRGVVSAIILETKHTGNANADLSYSETTSAKDYSLTQQTGGIHSAKPVPEVSDGSSTEQL